MNPFIQRIVGLLLILAAGLTSIWGGLHVVRFAPTVSVAVLLALFGSAILLDLLNVRFLGSVIAGLLIMILLVGGADQIVDGLLPALGSIIRPPRYTLVACMVLSGFAALIGGWTGCTAYGRPSPRPAQVLGVVSEVIGLGVVAAFWRIIPHYLPPVFLLVLPVMTRLGAGARTLTSAVAHPKME